MNKILFVSQAILIVLIVGLIIKTYEFKKDNDSLRESLNIDNYDENSDSLLYSIINTKFPIDEIVKYNRHQNVQENLDYDLNDIYLFIPELNCLTCLERSLRPFINSIDKAYFDKIIIITATANPRYIKLFKRNNFFRSNKTPILTLSNIDTRFLRFKNSFFFTLNYDHRITNIKLFNKKYYKDNTNYFISIMKN